ncbi:hypothetical protein [Mesorhizobium sp. ANAO-SY3R2]|uniref:hypothetical protein n=1 Tax=Mesorhizobium sp. ANAO-SY3R2 TaxID=3166644 RepID=UPI00366F9144
MLSASLLALPLAVSGCASSANNSVAAGAHGAQDTGTYPNLNILPKVAAPQLTEEQKTAKLAQLHSAQQRQGAKSNSAAAESTAMTTLARQHGAEALKAIQGKCDPIDPACN